MSCKISHGTVCRDTGWPYSSDSADGAFVGSHWEQTPDWWAGPAGLLRQAVHDWYSDRQPASRCYVHRPFGMCVCAPGVFRGAGLENRATIVSASSLVHKRHAVEQYCLKERIKADTISHYKDDLINHLHATMNGTLILSHTVYSRYAENTDSIIVRPERHYLKIRMLML